MAKEETTMIRVNMAALERLQAHGRKVTHNPKCSANDALLAVLGEYERLKRASRKAPIPGPSPVREGGEQGVADAEQVVI